MELLHGNVDEGIRQLCYVYYDMREHLGVSNEYTQRVESVLKQYGVKNPDDRYTEYITMREAARKLKSEFS